jgi:valyl-tRNA synthetase
MSKSKGNVINPMELIGKYGSDALRLGLISSRSAGQNQAFSASKVVAGRNLCNKLWNIARYIQDQIDKCESGFSSRRPDNLSLTDHWVLSRLQAAGANIEANLAAYRFAEAGELVYQTIWSDVADWYIEASKADFNPDMLAYVLETCLKLAHPFAPFATETIWQNLSWTNSLLISETWPEILPFNANNVKRFEQIMALITEVRFVTSELPGNKRYGLLYQTDKLIDEHSGLIKQLSRVPEVVNVDTPRGMRLAVSGHAAWLDVDADTMRHHHANLTARLNDTEAEITRLTVRLHNENYLKKAPAALVDETKQQLAAAEKLATRLKNELAITEDIS